MIEENSEKKESITVEDLVNSLCETLPDTIDKFYRHVSDVILYVSRQGDEDLEERSRKQFTEKPLPVDTIKLKIDLVRQGYFVAREQADYNSIPLSNTNAKRILRMLNKKLDECERPIDLLERVADNYRERNAWKHNKKIYSRAETLLEYAQTLTEIAGKLQTDSRLKRETTKLTKRPFK